MTNKTFQIVLIALAVALSALSENLFLKYIWWTACYSAWSGIPKMADQWRAAVFNASFNFWSFVALDLGSAAVLFAVLRLPASDGSGFLKHAPRAILALVVTILVTALLALVLSWVKQ
jgi:hypothetical protein